MNEQSFEKLCNRLIDIATRAMVFARFGTSEDRKQSIKELEEAKEIIELMATAARCIHNQQEKENDVE